jgi:hypothetical protein
MAVEPWRICAPPAAVAPAGHIRIDGWFGPTVNDSLVFVVNGREHWRGLYVLCTDERAVAAGSTTWRLAATDSIRSLYVIRGDTVRRAFHIGGINPSAMIIETAPR